MQVSFVIPLYNCLAQTRECLRTLQATLPAGLAHEIIFADDGSTDGTREWLRRLPAPCRALLNEQNVGFAGTCNRGAATATGEFLFFLNNDLAFLPGWFEPMRAAFDRFSDAGLVGNVQRNFATGALDHTGLFFNHKGKPEHDASLSRRDLTDGYRHQVPALTGACFAIRRKFWQSLGGFDTGFINGCEDVDLCLRAQATGRHNYVALRSVVRHHISCSPGRKRRDEANTRRLVERWRQQIAPLAACDWCRHYLETEWGGAHDPQDWRFALQALFYRLGWTARPPVEVLHRVNQAIEVELARWRNLPD
jgi:GT2 family glycosyltransferase